MNIYRYLSLLPLLIVPTAGIAAEAHVHGTATLQIAVDGNTLQLVLSSPLDNLLGFEHQPRTAKQKAEVKRMQETLRQAGHLFQPSSAAQCVLQSVELESPVLEDHSDATHDHGDHDHADMDGTFFFQCARPAELRDLEVKLFTAFPLLHQLKSAAATARGQAAATLTPDNPRISW